MEASRDPLVKSWERSLRARNITDESIHGYLNSIRSLEAYCTWAQIERPVADLSKAEIEAFFVWLRDVRHNKPRSLYTRHAHLSVFYRWLIDEGEITSNPFARLPMPAVDDTPPEIVTETMVRALLKATAGSDFYDRRDAALIRLLIDTGMRAASVRGILMTDLNLDEQLVTVHMKGRKTRTLPFGKKTAAALDRYLRSRARSSFASDPHLWIGRIGALGHQGIAGALEKRAIQAGLGHIHQHMFRHGFAHLWLSGGGNEGDLMELGGWNDYASMTKYARLTKQQRARDAHRTLSPGDRL